MTNGGELHDELGRRPVIEREQLFHGYVVDVEAQEFELGGSRIRREVIVHPGAVAVVAVDNQDRVALVHQYRHPAGGTLWELPAGLLDVPGEDPLDAAKRELAEEADLVADRWSLLLDISPSGGGSTEFVRIYLAEGVRDAPDKFDRADEEALMEKRWVPLAEVVDAVLDMRIHNADLIAGALALRAFRAERRQPHPSDAPFDWHPSNR